MITYLFNEMVRNKKQYPNKFILIGDILEEMIFVTQSKIIEGKILKVSDSARKPFLLSIRVIFPDLYDLFNFSNYK
jgi:hypothetical protein